MTKKDLPSFIKMLDLVADQYNRRIPEHVTMFYWEGLKEYSFDAVRQAASRHVMNPDTGQFMPKIADFVRMLQGTTQDSALTAWAKVDKAIRHVGTYVDVAFDDPLIHRIVTDMGGWIALGTKVDSEWPFVAKEFENRYKGFKMRGETPEYPVKLIGITTAYNEKEGFKTDPPILVGNEAEALRVMQSGSDKPTIGFTKLSKETLESLSIKQITEAI